MYIINCFFIYSVLGFFLEGTYNLFLLNEFKSGILYGPWTPIYGIGAIIIIEIYKIIFTKINKNKTVKNIIFFICTILILTLIEWLGGILIENLFHKTLWNYQNYKFNIGKYITLEISLTWTILSFILIYLIKPIIDKIEKKIPKKLTLLLIIFMLIDIFVTVFTK